jgi:dipeptidyl aminopeptidase/acylaminoacyl peptidase
MHRPGLMVARVSSIAIVLALVACGGSSNETSGAESGDGSETFTPPDVGSTSTDASSTSDSPASQDSSTAPDVGSMDVGSEGMVGNITAPGAGTGGDAAEAGSSDASGGDAPSADDMPTPSPQLWEQKRAALLEIIGRPEVPLDARETALPDDAGLTVQEFSIATDASTRINGTSFAPKIEGPLPAVIYLHGTGGSRQDGFALLRTLAQRGFFALAIDARHHGPGVGQNP